LNCAGGASSILVIESIWQDMNLLWNVPNNATRPVVSVIQLN